MEIDQKEKIENEGDTMTVSERLAEFSSRITYDSLPEEVIRIAVSCVYNYIGCVYSGSGQPPPLAMVKMLDDYFPTGGKCAVIGTGRTTDPVTAAKLLKLSEEQTIWAIGSAGTQATGLQECTGNMAQRFHLGTASRNGVLGALLAKNGFDGPPRILDGEQGFFKAMSEYSGNLLELFVDLGEHYTILDTTFKFYPCCGHIHACIDGAIINMQKNGIQPEQIERVEVATYQTALHNSGNPHPKDIAESKFSIPYCVAAGILNGQVTVQEFASWPPAPETLEMMTKVELSVDPDVEAAFPGQRGAKVTIHTQNSSFMETRNSRKGDPDCPLSREDILQKYRALTSMVLTREQTDQLENLISRLTDLQDVSVLTTFY